MKLIKLLKDIRKLIAGTHFLTAYGTKRRGKRKKSHESDPEAEREARSIESNLRKQGNYPASISGLQGGGIPTAGQQSVGWRDSQGSMTIKDEEFHREGDHVSD
jgi:hypothetical protein